MIPTSRFRELPRAGGSALAVLLLLGVLLGGFHHHVGIAGDDHCIVCALSHTTATASPVVAVPAAPVLLIERAFIARATPPESATQYSSPSRAPPLS